MALYLADWEAGISSQGTAGGRVGEVGLTAPLPMLGLGVHTGVAKRLFLGGNLGLFFLKVGDYEGSIVEINAYLTYQLLSFLSLGGGYTAFSVDVQSEAPDFRGEIRYRFDGPSLSTTVSF